MRLQLKPSATTVLVVLLSLEGTAHAQSTDHSVRVRSSLYQDDDQTTISTTTVAATGVVSEDVTVSARYLLDAISSASVDVVSAATGRWTEDRHELAASASWATRAVNLSGAYVYSVENDWSSHTGSLGLSRDFMDHDVTLGVGGGWVANRIWRRDDSTFRDSLRVINANVYANMVLDPENLVSLDYTVSALSGYQASPYRFARFRDLSSPQQLFFANGEFHPKTRLRHSLTLRWNRHLLADAALRSHVRLYRDDWGVASITAGTEGIVGIGDWDAALFVRGYAQHHAAFYQDVYDRQRRFMTADRELSSFVDGFAGARVVGSWKPERGAKEVRVELKVTGFGFSFPEFSRLPSRLGWIAELGGEVTF